MKIIICLAIGLVVGLLSLMLGKIGAFLITAVLAGVAVSAYYDKIPFVNKLGTSSSSSSSTSGSQIKYPAI